MSLYNLNVTVETKVCYGGSWGNSPWEDVVLRITAWANLDLGRGGFEIYDVDTGGEAYYGEGGLWFDEDGDLVDYDGVYDLDREIREWIEMEVGA